MAKNKPGKKWAAILTVDLGDHGGTRSFRSLEQVRDWLEVEKEAWKWVGDLTAKRDRLASLAMNLWQKITPQFSRIESQIPTGTSELKDETRLASLRDVIQSAYINEGLIHSSSPRAKVVFAEQEVSDAAGLGALSYYMHEPQDATDPLVFRGRLQAVLAELGLYGTAEASRKALDDLDADIRRQFVDYKTEQDDLLTASRGFNKTIEAQITTHDAAHKELIKVHNHDFSNLVKKSKEEWENLREAYDKQLALRAPVDYWSQKRDQHRKDAEWWGKRFRYGLGATTLILIPALVGILWGETLKPGMIGVAAVLVTFALWGLSIVARNLLSHQHLATDADERVVMVNTYLALLQEGKGLKDPQIEFIIQALFRSASTGIVKDDAQPPSILGKLMGKF